MGHALTSFTNIVMGLSKLHEVKWWRTLMVEFETFSVSLACIGVEINEPSRLTVRRIL